MTGNTSKFRAVFLAALMVLSIFAGTVAFTGSAAAANATYAGGAVHYNNDSGGSGNYVIEVPFDNGASLSGVTLNAANYKLLDDDTNASSKINYSKSVVSADGKTVYLNTSGSAIQSNDLEIELSSNVVSSSDGKTISVAFAAKSYNNSSISDQNVYQGTTVAIYDASSPPTDFAIEGDDTSYFQEFAAGTNSEVFYVDTGDLELDTYDFDGRANFTVRDLGLGVSVDDVNVTTEDTIDGTVNARASNRAITLDLLDSNGDSVATQTATLSGQGEYDYSFASQETGDYTVQVLDNASGVEVESSTITVTEAADNDASFVSNTISDQRGDVIEFTVETESTDTSTVVFGSSSDGVIANATLVDDDGDNQVTAYLNTTDLVNQGSSNAFSLADDSDDEIDGQTVYQGVDDLVDAGEYDFEVRPGSDATADSTGVATVVLEERSTTGINTWTLPSSVSVADLEDINEAADDGELTQTDEIANGDKVVHEIQSTGLEGILNAQHNEGITNRFLNKRDTVYNFTVEQADAGANQQAWNLTLTSNNVSVVADGDNDTYYVVVDTGSANVNGDSYSGNSKAIPDDEGLTANFTVYGNDASSYGDFLNPDEYDDDENEETLQDYEVVEPTISVDEPYNVSNAAGQMVSGETTLAPGTELNLRVRSQSGTSPSFLKTASPVVQSDQTWSAEFDFSEQNIGDEYDIIVNDGSGGADEVTESGTVVEAMATDTATPEPDTDTATPEPDTATPEPDTATPEPDTATPEPDTDTPTSTPTSTPGFGVIVALTALVAAALLAIRRD